MANNRKKRSTDWSKAEIAFLKKHYSANDMQWLAWNICRPERGIEAKAHRLGLKKKGHYWKKSEVKGLLKMVGKKTHQQMADALGKTRYGVIQKLRSLKND